MKDFYLYRHAWISTPHFNERLSDEQCDALLKQGGWLVRNTYNFDQKEPSNFWYIIKDSFGGMAEHSQNERKKIRRALKSFEYRRVEKQLIVGKGYDILKQVRESYKVHDRVMNEMAFRELLDGWDEKENEFWGTFDKNDGRFVGFAVVRMFDIGCFYEMVTFYPEYKHNATYPFYGMFYILNQHYLGERQLKYVTDGSRSITEHSNIQPFLEQNFKFRKAYCKLKLHYKWWFGIIVRLLYPFRNIILNRNIQAVLKMHGMQSL